MTLFCVYVWSMISRVCVCFMYCLGCYFRWMDAIVCCMLNLPVCWLTCPGWSAVCNFVNLKLSIGEPLSAMLWCWTFAVGCAVVRTVRRCACSWSHRSRSHRRRPSFAGSSRADWASLWSGADARRSPQLRVQRPATTEPGQGDAKKNKHYNRKTHVKRNSIHCKLND